MSDLIERAREASTLKYQYHTIHVPTILERLAAELERLTAENAALRADAERHRFMMADLRWQVFSHKRGAQPVRYAMRHDGEGWGGWHDTPDAAIDSAARRSPVMADHLTGDTLREHAAAPRTVAWEDQARALLRWAADLVDAAKAIRDERNGDD